MKSIQLGIVGAGNMASAMVRGLITSGRLAAAQIRVSDVSDAQCEAFRLAYGVQSADSTPALVAWANVVLIAVKPQVVPSILPDLAAAYRQEQLILSIAAGVATNLIGEALAPGARVVRAMPNTPALVLEGATAIARGQHATEADITVAKDIFDAVGATFVLEESQMDAVTGLSGSGPAYVMLVVEALADGGVRMGLKRETALALAVRTLYGSAKLLLESGEHPAALKDKVASPAGTTIAGLCALEQHGVRSAFIEAVTAATLRSTELGKR
ncbi:MAG TPA: pyrroline-5-carboxylate reductase [Polyangiaceae bacterium]|nr:pyrroline-5-carboxylate reductase [Polyangiaceae bacterium]